MNLKLYRVMISISTVILLIFACSCSNQAQVSNSLMQINEDGTMTEIESIKTEGGNLSDSDIVALGTEIDSLLQELDYIEDSTVILSYYPGNTETLCFQACLRGENLDGYIGKILDVIEGKMGSCDLEHSSIVDSDGNYYSPAQ